jgi:hypothetical protein
MAAIAFGADNTLGTWKYKKDTSNHDYLDSRRTDEKDAGNSEKQGLCCETPRPRRADQGQAGPEGPAP